MQKAAPTHAQLSDKRKYRRLHALIEGFTSFDEGLETAADRHRDVAFAVCRDAMVFKYHYLMALLPSKFEEGHISDKSKDEAAMESFLQAEVDCRKANERLYDAFNRPSASRWWGALDRARRTVAAVLGRFDVEALPRHCSFSSGASTEFNRSESEPQKKWAEATHVTLGALPYVIAFTKWCGYKTSQQFTVVDGNVVFTVPKNYKKKRTCAKEPSWNMFMQKGIGEMMRSRLQRVGLLHADAQFRHMHLARVASERGHLATLDLKAASDSISNALVDLLLPDDWKEAVYALRSPVGRLPNGEVITYEKISSMGNGFTFELETLLFYALCKAVCGKEELVSVYGDDLIVPTHRAAAVTRLFRFCGFALNPEKSFSEGLFRESCGGHYYGGVDVKPFYIRRLPTDLSQVILLHNDIVEWFSTNLRGFKLHRLIEIARACRAIVPRSFWGPIGTDGALWAEWDEARPKFSGKLGRRTPSRRPVYQHWRVKTVRRMVVKQQHDYYYGSLLSSLAKQIRKRNPAAHVDLSQRRRSLAEFALEARSIEQVSPVDFSYALSKLQYGWTSVGVSSQWPTLPVRLA